MLEVPHIINNAYGVQSADICKRITAACRRGNVDAIVQSTDKNFMVPVGGAIVAGPLKNNWLVDKVNKNYPGRASISAHLDLLITLLHWGATGWKQVLQDREYLFPILQQQLSDLAQQWGERVLFTPDNPISCAMTLDTCGGSPLASEDCQIPVDSSKLDQAGTLTSRADKHAASGNESPAEGDHGNCPPDDSVDQTDSIEASSATADEHIVNVNSSSGQAPDCNGTAQHTTAAPAAAPAAAAEAAAAAAAGAPSDGSSLKNRGQGHTFIGAMMWSR